MDFDGTWMISVPTPLGKQDVLLDIIHGNGVLSGTATLGNETVPFIDPVVNGNEISWSQQVTKPMKMQIKFELAAEGNTLCGKAKPGYFPSIGVSGARVS